MRHAPDAPAVIDGAIDLALRRRKPVMPEIACNLASMPVPAPRPRRFGAVMPVYTYTTESAARKTPVRQALSQRVAVCGRLGGTSTMVRIADLGEQCGRSSEALPIPGYFSKEQWFRL